MSSDGDIKAEFVTFSVKGIFDLVKAHIKIFKSHPYFTDVTEAKLWQYQPNINVTFHRNFNVTKTIMSILLCQWYTMNNRLINLTNKQDISYKQNNMTHSKILLHGIHFPSLFILNTDCVHKWGQYTPALITTHLIQKYPIKIFILQSCATQMGFFQENEAKNTKMYRDQETHTIRINVRYEMNWANVFSKSAVNSIFSQIFGHQRPENEARNTKIYRSQETHPVRVNAWYEMNWANSFLKKFRKPHFRPNIWPPEGRKWG